MQRYIARIAEVILMCLVFNLTDSEPLSNLGEGSDSVTPKFLEFGYDAHFVANDRDRRLQHFVCTDVHLYECTYNIVSLSSKN